MPDVFDPYEERGVPNPHEPPETELDLQVAHGTGSSNIPAPLMTKTDIEKERKRIRRRQEKRIRPGFYEGLEPLGDGLD